MEVKGILRCKFVKMGVAGALLLSTGIYGTSAMAQVKGTCENCHTMHNNQDGNTQVHVGAGAAWNPTTHQLEGNLVTGAQNQLLKSDCVGCHSSSDKDTTIVTDASGNRIPIVLNLGGYPVSPLAGGNFYNQLSSNLYGHNVAGISGDDATINGNNGGVAPGGIGCAGSCHASLALSDAATTEPFKIDGMIVGTFNGCKGCHNRVGHHNSNDTSYRFLGGHGTIAGFPAVREVDGGLNQSYESSDWEQSPSAGNHNFYKNQTDIMTKDSIGAFCAGCHGTFHAMGKIDPFSGTNPNGGDDNTDGLIVANSAPSNPWLRHPTNVNIPLGDTGGEYNALLGATYNPAIPVAQDPAGNKDAIDVGDQVMCLSCHRAHASDQPDALRFNYVGVGTQMIAHNNTGAGTGCFYCHTTKDNP